MFGSPSAESRIMKSSSLIQQPAAMCSILKWGLRKRTTLHESLINSDTRIHYFDGNRREILQPQRGKV